MSAFDDDVGGPLGDACLAIADGRLLTVTVPVLDDLRLYGYWTGSEGLTLSGMALARAQRAAGEAR